jgi:hypothetical protein
MPKVKPFEIIWSDVAFVIGGLILFFIALDWFINRKKPKK